METKTKLPAVINQAVKAQDIDLGRVNFMLPSQTFGEVIGAFDKVTLEIVQVDPNPKNGDVYEVAKGRYALSKIPLKKIAAAISIQWVPDKTGVVECTSRISRAKATGVMRKPNGELITITDEKVIDIDVVEEELLIKAEEAAEKGNPDKVTEWGEKNGKSFPKKFAPWESDAARDRWIEKTVRTGRLQKRKFKNELAVTGAIDRVIRAFVATKNTYTTDELTRPFVFPRVTLDTNKMLDDPKTREAALGMISGNTSTIYGSGNGGERAEKAEEKKAVLEHIDNQEKVQDAEIVDEDPFAEVAEPELSPEEQRRKTAVEALHEYYRSDYLSPTQKKAVKDALDNEGTSIDHLEELKEKCKKVEEKNRRGQP